MEKMVDLWTLRVAGLLRYYPYMLDEHDRDEIARALESRTVEIPDEVVGETGCPGCERLERALVETLDRMRESKSYRRAREKERRQHASGTFQNMHDAMHESAETQKDKRHELYVALKAAEDREQDLLHQLRMAGTLLRKLHDSRISINCHSCDGVNARLARASDFIDSLPHE